MENFNSSNTIKFLDKLCEARFGLKRLPVIPNTQGKYIAQYVDTTGVRSSPWGTGKNVIIYRVYKTHMQRYYIDIESKNLKNENSQNATFTPRSNEDLIFRILRERRCMSQCVAVSKFDTFVSNVDKLVEQKSNPYAILENMLTKLTGRKVKFDLNKIKEDSENYVRIFDNSLISNRYPFIINELNKAQELAFNLHLFIENNKTFLNNYSE